MATGNLLLGTARKKLGDVVFYRYNGQQRSRPRIRQIANPRTYKQAVQRMALAATTSYVRWFTPVFNNSFDGQSNGGLSLNRFRKLAMPIARAAAADSGPAAGFEPKGSNFISYIEGIQISEGNILFNPSTDVGLNANEGYIGLTTPSATILNADGWNAFLAANNMKGGDQLTLLVVWPQLEDAPEQCVGAYGRLIAHPAADIEFPVEGLPIVVGGRLNPILFDTENIEAAAVTNTTQVSVAFSVDDMEPVQMGAILTRVVNGVQKHSTAFMVLNSSVSGNNAASFIPSYMGVANPEVQAESEWFTENAENPT